MEDKCDWNGDDRRKHCELIIHLKTQFDDDKRQRDEWRRDIDKKLESIVIFLQDIRGPYRAGLWAFRIFAGAVLVAFSGFVIELVRRHIK